MKTFKLALRNIHGIGFTGWYKIPQLVIRTCAQFVMASFSRALKK
jgi:hypothetical protein